MLQLEKVYVSFESRHVISDVSFNLAKGEVLSIVGESGVGKTTLLRAISGLLDIQGTITFDEKRVIGPSEKLVAGVEGIATVFQDYQLMHNRTVFENIAYPLRSYVEEEQEAKTKVLLNVLELDSYKDHYPKELSGGQKQRVAIGRALASEPTLLLLDEPFSNMDTALKEIMKEQVFKYLKNEDISAILVTHDPKDALAVSSRIAILKHGEVAQLANPKEIYESPIDEYAMTCFGLCNFWSTDSFIIDFEKTMDGKYFNRVGIRVTDLSVVEISEAACEVEVIQSVFQGDNYLLRGKLKSENEVYFHHKELITIGEKVGLDVEKANIIYFP